MLEMIYNIALQKNNWSNQDNNFFNVIHESDLSKSVFNQLNKYFQSKEVEFDNVFTEEKKDNDKIIISTNFVINNLLYILNKKDISLNSNSFKSSNSSDIIKNKNIPKKKIDINKNILLENINFLNKIKNLKFKKDKEKNKILKKELCLSELIKKKNHFYHIDEFNNANTVKNLNSIKLNTQHFPKKKNFFYTNKNKIKFIKDEKKIASFSNIKTQKNSLFLSKNINKINNLMNEKKIFKDINRKEYIKSNIDSLILNHSENSIKWKKLISQKIFLSISNKDNQAEIHLKPKCLGPVHIIINMKNDEVVLNFISKNNNVRTFLDSSIPFLRNSLIESGIKLEKFNIHSSFKNYINLSRENIFSLNKFKKKSNVDEKKTETMKYKLIDIYV